MSVSRGQSILQRYIELLVGKNKFVVNARPDFLDGLEYDIFFPGRRAAFEFNGDQHYVDTKTFGSCVAQKDRDGRKKYLSRKNGITLYSVDACHLSSKKIISFLYAMKFSHVRQQANKHREALSLLDAESSAYRIYLLRKYPGITTVFSPRNRRRMYADTVAGRYDADAYSSSKGAKNWNR